MCLTEEYADVFDGVGEIPGAHTITIEDTVKQVIHAPRRVALRSKIKAKLDELVDRGVIVPFTEPTRWVSSMLAVVKPNKNRICIDQRDLNRVIRREHYQLPTVDEVISRLTGAKKFTLCDVKDGFHQIKLDILSTPPLDGTVGLACPSVYRVHPKFGKGECTSLLKISVELKS